MIRTGLDLVAIQGLAGSYSEEALHRHRPAASAVCLGSFGEVFEALSSGTVARAFLPFENSTAGFISENYARLAASDFKIVAAEVHKVEHCLLVKPGTRLEDLRRVRSHPQALKQCAAFLQRHRLTPEDYFDTAAAARDLQDGEAAIASARAAELYGCEILRGGIQDFETNATRFFRIEKAASWGRRLILALTHDQLTELMQRGLPEVWVSLVSVPRTEEAWKHLYCLELALSDASAAEALASQFPKRCLLGSFEPSARCP